jgi:hypothetical protein
MRLSRTFPLEISLRPRRSEFSSAVLVDKSTIYVTGFLSLYQPVLITVFLAVSDLSERGRREVVMRIFLTLFIVVSTASTRPPSVAEKTRGLALYAQAIGAAIARAGCWKTESGGTTATCGASTSTTIVLQNLNYLPFALKVLSQFCARFLKFGIVTIILTGLRNLHEPTQDASSPSFLVPSPIIISMILRRSSVLTPKKSPM